MNDRTLAVLTPADTVTPVNGQRLPMPITLGTALALIDFSDWLWLAYKFPFDREWRMEELGERQQWLECMRESGLLSALEETLGHLSSIQGLPLVRLHTVEDLDALQGIARLGME